MSKHCINHLRITYDCCRSCSGKDNDCPEYLDGKFEYKVYHSRQTKPIQHSLKSLSLDNYDGSIPFKEGQDKTADTYIPNSLEEWLKQKIKRIGDKR
jgi:hypothetical protein